MAKKHILQKEVAEVLGITEGGFTYKLQRGVFTVTDLCKIANMMGCELEINLRASDAASKKRNAEPGMITLQDFQKKEKYGPAIRICDQLVH